MGRPRQRQRLASELVGAHTYPPEAIATAAANYLGITSASLNRQLRSQTFAQIARARGKAVAGLQNALAAAVKKDVDANQALTRAEKSAIAAVLAGKIGSALTAHCPNGHGTGWWF